MLVISRAINKARLGYSQLPTLVTRPRQAPWYNLSTALYFRWSIRFDKNCTVQPRFNEVAGDRPNLFVKWRVCYIEYLDRYNEFEGKRPKSSLYRGHS